MITSIQKSNSLNFQTYFLNPFVEATLRIQKCAESTDFTQIDHPSRPLSDRAIDLVIGLSLLIPLINAIIWVALQRFGDVKSLIEKPTPLPFQPWNEAVTAAEKPAQPPIPIREVADGQRAPLTVETYQTLDQLYDRTTYTSDVKIERYSNEIVVTTTTPFSSTLSIYDNKWALQTIRYENSHRELDVTICREKDTLIVAGTKEGEGLNLRFTLPDPSTPWIQQPEQGARPFVTSDALETLFYGIDPRDISLTKGKLKKMKVSTSPEYGPVVEVGLSAASLPKSLVGVVRRSLHHPKTGQQYQENMRVPFPFSYTFSSKLEINH